MGGRADATRHRRSSSFAVSKADSPGLDEDVADGSGFDRSGEHRSPGPVGDEPTEQGVLAAAADHVDDADRLPAESLGVVEGPGVGDGEALEDAPYRLCIIRPVQPFRGEQCGDPWWHIARREEGGVVDVEHGPAVCVLGRRNELVEVDPGPGALPGVDAFVDQPHAHDVAQVADSPVDTALVGEVRDAALLGEDRLIELDTDEGPGAGADVRRAWGEHRDGDDGGGGVVRADRDHADGLVGANLVGDRGGKLPDDLAGADELREEPAGKAEPVDKRGIPASGDDVEQAGGRRVGAFGALGSGEPVGDEVGDEQHRRGVVEDAFGLVDGELIEAVKGEELQAVHAVESLRFNQLVHGADAAAGAGVAVVVGSAGHPVAVAGGAHEGVVDGPRVDADAEQGGLDCDGLAQSFEDVAVELEGVPVQAVGGADRLVGEPVHDLDVEPVRSDPAEDDAAAGSAEVDGRDGTGG